jgi:hypothetical protein
MEAHRFTAAGTIDPTMLSHDGTYPNMEIRMSTRKKPKSIPVTAG